MHFQFTNGDRLLQRNNSLIISFSGARNVLSTSPYNGGYRDDLQFAFNHGAERTPADVRGESYRDHIAVLTTELGLPADKTCGLSTAAYMENAAIVSCTYQELNVTAVVTAGIDVNGGRAGDPADLHESDQGFVYLPGTVNILLSINTNLTEGAMARALVTCTEAKTAAIQELMTASRYSSGLATGSGTDGVILVADAQSPITLTDAGLHFKLGELIGRAVKDAVKQALYRETGLCPARQFDLFRRLDRFGVTRDAFLTLLASDSRFCTVDRSVLEEQLNRFSVQPDLVVQASLFAHLLDQLAWNLISDQDARRAAIKLFTSLHTGNAALDHQLLSGTIDLHDYLLHSLAQCF